ncbi:MAG: ABC transporter permease subunit [Promethearchaeota archaeon]
MDKNDYNENNIENKDQVKNKDFEEEVAAAHEYDDIVNFKYVKTLFIKDWMEIRGYKELFYPIIILPVLFAVFYPILFGIMAISDPSSVVPGGSVYDALNLMMNMLLKPMFLFIPTVIPMIIASDSFAGERERKTLESLLILPITNKELFLGKLLASFLPGVIFSVVSFFIMGGLINLIILLYHVQVPPQAPMIMFGDVTFWLLVFILSPLISILNTIFGIMVSIRTKTMKSAQSISGIFVLPIVGIILAAIINPSFLANLWYITFISLIIALLNYVLWIVGSKLINREKLISNLD